MPTSLTLLPLPRKVTLTGGMLDLRNSLIALEADPAAPLRFGALQAQDALKKYAGLDYEIVAGTNNTALLTISLVDGVGNAEGYRLTITANDIRIVGNDAAGAYYGVQTLIQLLRTHGAHLPQLEIEDVPDFSVRGVMLDISRDKVPTMKTLYDLIDWLASLKINQFQLYTEHTFAYRRHPKVWAKASPVTSEEILALDVYCKERFIELVPNQNSFGHMHRWLQIEEYDFMAEAHEAPFDWMTVPFSISPAEPKTLPFLEGLYDELLPNFTSKMFNIGADETWDLGAGRSKPMVEAQGKGRVYLDFVLEIYKRVKARGRTMQFWGDIINQYPELVPEIPKDTIALEWGYEADHPFAEKSALFAASGIPFYVCPGTSTWTSITGRTDNMLGNIRNSIENGIKNGAIGVLNTDWGDRGHWQQLPMSYPGFAYGAARSWNAHGEFDLTATLDKFAFGDSTGVMGKLAYDLGNTYQQPGVHVHNGNMLFWIYERPISQMRENWRRMAPDANKDVLNSDSLLLENLYGTMEYVDDVMKPLDSAQIDRPDAELIKREYRQGAHMLQHAAKRGLLELGDNSVKKADLLADLDAIIEEQKALWLARNRPGGLDDSLTKLVKARETYQE